MPAAERFADRVAIITGAASGIGLATAKLLSRDGASTLLVDLNHNGLETGVQEIREKGQTAECIRADVGAECDVRRAVDKALSSWGRIDYLVNNAASFVQKGVDASAEEWHQAWKTNVLGAALFTRLTYPAMKKVGGGAVVNLSSVSGLAGEANYATYNSSKAALLVQTMCMAVDLGGYNIRVNAVSPGVTITPTLMSIIEKDGSTWEEVQRTWPEKQCLKRLCYPEDVANAVAFLLSDDASCITGTNLVVDAGYMAKK